MPMKWSGLNDPDEPISNIGRFCLLENIEEANPTDVAYEEGADGISYLGPKNISGTLACLQRMTCWLTITKP